MCGIAGFWQQKPKDEPLALLQRMAASLAHRGPDDSGIFFDKVSGIGLGFSRLSIIDLSAQGHQPMQSASGRYTIVFNGEVYNFEEIRRELGSQPWRGHSDTEVMLAAFERWGLDAALRRFVGMFAFALWDGHQRRLHLVRDRAGVKPLYYGRVGSDLVFGSELKAIRGYPDFQDEIDRDQLAAYLRLSYVPSPHSIYRGIGKLEAGEMATFRAPGAEPELKKYWSAAAAARHGLDGPIRASDEEVVDELHTKLKEAVRLRMISDVPLGAFLSGGIDSSTLVALMQAQSSQPVKTFTIGFREQPYNEAPFAKQVAEHLGTEHTELYVTPDEAREVIPLLSSIYDEPFADASQVPTYLVAKLARQKVTVSLSGDGGDELFCGYTRFTRFNQIWNLIARTPRFLQRAISGGILCVSQRTLDRMVALVPPLQRKWQLSPGRKMHKLARALRDARRANVYLSHIWQYHGPQLVLGSNEPDLLLRRIAELDWVQDPRDLAMLIDLTNYLPDDVLTKLDRASMAVSLEARVPLLDFRVVEFAWKLPLHFKTRNGVSKWALRQIAYRYVPAAMLDRPKMGFGVPIAQWLRGELRNWAEDLLATDTLQRDGLLDAVGVRQMWKEHLAGSHNWDVALWNVLMFQDWLACVHKRRKTEPLPDKVAGSPLMRAAI